MRYSEPGGSVAVAIGASRAPDRSALVVRHHLRMSHPKAALIDTALIVGGAGLSTLFVSTDGNGQNPLPVAAGMLLVVFITGLVSFGLAWFVRSVPLAVTVSVVITDLLFVFYFVCRFVFSQGAHEHGNEELILLPIVFVVVSAPTVLLSSIGFGRFASRIYQRKSAT